VITKKITTKDLIHGTQKFLLMKAGHALFSVNLEVTLRCNLRCNFCNFWQDKNKETRLKDYSSIVRHLNPLHLTITGGEPLLRSDLESIIGRIHRNTDFIYMNLITNGSLLNKDRALSLWNAGLNQLSVSLDFPDERHDKLRGFTGLWRHIEKLLPSLADTEMDNLCLNTVIMKENLGSLLEIAQLASKWGIKVSFSTYNPFKSNNSDHIVPEDQIRYLQQMIEDLIEWKRKYRNITNSDFYLRTIPKYFRDGYVSGCLAGRKWVQVSPNGILRRCSDQETLGDYRKFRPNRIPATECRQCWYACRGEAEAPLGLKRIVELNR